MDTVLRNGFVWPARDRDCHAVVFSSLADMEPALALCRGFEVAVQAGGNCGVWAEWLSHRFTTVFTFEPDATNFACLKRNVPVNVIAQEAGLFVEAGRSGLIADPRNIGAHFLNGDGDIDLVALDDLSLPGCDYLCLDIEGAEMPALLGAQALIEQYRPVIQIEDKGLSRKFGYQKGDAEIWLADEFGYVVRGRPGRDVILSVDL